MTPKSKNQKRYDAIVREIAHWQNHEVLGIPTDVRNSIRNTYRKLSTGLQFTIEYHIAETFGEHFLRLFR